MRNHSPYRRRALAAGLLTTIAGLATGAGIASGDGGTSPDASAKVKDVICVERCLDTRSVAETGKVQIIGKGLEDTETVKFKSDGRRLEATARRVSETSALAKVPEGSVSGRVVVVDASGSTSTSPEALEIGSGKEITSVEDFELRSAEATPTKSFFNGKRKSELDYVFESDGPTDVRIDVVSKKRGKVVDSVVKRKQEPFTSNTFRWSGLSAKRKVAPNGKYRFEVSPVQGGKGGRAGFSYFDHIFPMRVKHSYGDGLGAGRNHQGQDVFARCGAKMLAARGGRVQTAAYQSSAGYYVVIDGRKTGEDYTYMHMERRGRPKEGERVRTGERIGYISDTGNASGCHLHFELWSAPGWYEGGHPVDPTPALEKWDAWS